MKLIDLTIADETRILFGDDYITVGVLVELLTTISTIVRSTKVSSDEKIELIRNLEIGL